MNEFEKNPQSNNNDIIDSGIAFVSVFVFMFVVFGIGVVFSVLGG